VFFSGGQGNKVLRVCRAQILYFHGKKYMNILLVAATPFEIAPTLDVLEQDYQKRSDGSFEKGGTNVRPVITGVGMTATAWRLGYYFARHKPDWALNAGIAGAFDHSLNLGDVVQVATDRFGDLGVEEADGRFVDVFEMGLEAPDEPPFQRGVLHNPATEQAPYLPLVHGLTVNRVHGFAPSISAVQNKYPDAQIETMEGAAFFHACLMADIPFAAIRGISNYVEPRNREAWEIGLAIRQLNEVLLEMLRLVPE